MELTPNGLSGYSIPVLLSYFFTTIHKNCGRGESLGTNTYPKAVVGVSKGMLPVKHLRSNKSSFCYSRLQQDHKNVTELKVNLATLSSWDIARFKTMVPVCLAVAVVCLFVCLAVAVVCLFVSLAVAVVFLSSSGCCLSSGECCQSVCLAVAVVYLAVAVVCLSSGILCLSVCVAVAVVCLCSGGCCLSV